MQTDFMHREGEKERERERENENERERDCYSRIFIKDSACQSRLPQSFSEIKNMV